VLAAGADGLPAWNATRPPFVEAAALQTAALIADAAGAQLYAVHTSSAAALRSRAAGMRVAIETCPRYLTHDETWDVGDVGKINPPLRTAADREALWQGLLSGDIDTVATDHVHRAKAGPPLRPDLPSPAATPLHPGRGPFPHRRRSRSYLA
jgi:dihydropyrimidinase